MAFKSKYKGFEIEEILDQVKTGPKGIPIVSSVEELEDLHVDTGSLAIVSVPGSIQETSFRNLYYPVIDTSSNNIDTTNFASVDEVKFTFPTITASETMGGVALVNKDYSDENIKTCALIASLVEGNQFVAASIVDCATQNISEHIICMYDAGNPVVDDIALEQVDAFIKDNELCFMAYMDENFQVIAQENITDDIYNVVDLFFTAVSGVPTTGEVYIKKDKWNTLTFNYSDLKGKPIIPTDASVLNWGYVKNIVVNNVEKNGNNGKINIGNYCTNIKYNSTQKNINTSGVIDLGYIHKRLQTTVGSNIYLSPNIYYRKTDALTSFTVILSSASDSTIMNEYFLEFTVPANGVTVSLPVVKWMNGEPPIFEAGATYQLSIVNDLGSYIKFS